MSRIFYRKNFICKGLRQGGGDNAGSISRGLGHGFGIDEIIFGCFGGIYSKAGRIWPRSMVLGMGSE